MSGDYSRVRFDPKNDFSAVLMQQGRVQLDSDWNELAALLDRRWRAETTDIIGRGTVPKETPDGFRIQIAASGLTIGRGRIYVDGLLAENHGKAPLEFDAVLAEQRGTLAVPYDEQPYFPNVAVVAPAPTTGGPHLVYVDVWRREVTFLEDLNLVEKAVGIDTTTRWQTVWQVKILANVGSSATCGSPLEAWNGLIAPSDGRLSSAAVGVPTNVDPCLLPPSGGYRGLENRLYRVEIHDGGPSGTATFKWSRDNASVATSVTAITALDKLTVASVGRDSVMHFKIGDWIEVTDDWLEFARQPGVSPQPAGVLAQIKNIDDANRIITLVSPIPANVFGTDAQGNTDPARHTRVRRWDQSGQVRDTNGNLLVDLNAPGAKGVIPVPATGTSIVLEDGVQITFDTPAGGNYKIGDYWNFAARTADASVEELKQAPPLGVHHHFSRLALVTFPSSVTDCRTLWPPEVAGEGCECTVCVSAASHNQGTLTIQMAVEQVKAAGGGTICLGVGTYNLGEAPMPININGARSLTLRGQGAQTSLVYAGSGPALVVDGSSGVTIEKLMLATAAREGEAQPAILFNNSSSVTLQRCAGLRLGTSVSSAVVGLAGILIGTIIRENIFLGPIGIGNATVAPLAGAVLAAQTAPLLTMALTVEDNMLLCSRRGVSLIGVSLHILETRLAGNFFNDCAQGGIVALGFVASGSSMVIHDNELRVNGQGIVVGISGAQITANNISGSDQRTGADGIVLDAGLDKTGIDQCQVIGNRISSVGGIGVSVEAAVKSAMIKNNFIDGAVFGGIGSGNKSSAAFLTVENNEIANVTAQPNDAQATVIGIRLMNVKRGEIVDNTISGVGLLATNFRCVGIQLVASASLRVAGNDIVDVGPPQANAQTSAGIESIGTFDQLDVVNNQVRRSASVGQVDNSDWHAVLISGAQTPPPGLKGMSALFGVKTNLNFLVFANRLLAVQLGAEMLSLHGNFLNAYGVTSAVQAVLSGACTCSDNRSLLRGREQPSMEIAAAAVVLSANHVQGTQGKVTVTLKLPDRGPFTVLGNITTHGIEINGAALGAPWAPLNVQA
ncbi:MAG: DUF6519 domain-containing protein [Chloroflexota bacterium]